MNSQGIAKKLTALRGKRRRREVAAACDISVSALCMYEMGYRIPKDEIKVRLANYYKISVESLFYAQE